MRDCNNSDNTRSSETSTPISDIIEKNLAIIVNSVKNYQINGDFINSRTSSPIITVSETKVTKSESNELFQKVIRFLDAADMFSRVGAIESIQVVHTNEKKAVKKDANLKENYHTIQ